MPFEWDPSKAKANRKKHGLSFEEVTELFSHGSNFLEIYDEQHSDEEDRFIAIGPTRVGVVVVVYTEPADDVFRIVSARKATNKEVDLFRRFYGGTHE